MRKVPGDYFFAFGAYVICTLILFFPVLPQLNSALIGPPEDNMQFLWFLWYGITAWVDPAVDFFHTTKMYYPEGMSLYFANYFYVGVALAAVLKPVLGLVLTYNSLVLLSFILTGVSAYALIRYLTGHHWASLIGGFVYAFNPQHIAKTEHHVHLASIYFIPLFILFWLKAREGTRVIWRCVLCAVFLSLSALCDWNYLVYGLLILAFDLVYSAVESKRLFDLASWKRVIIIGLSSFVFLSFVIVPMLYIGIKHAGEQRVLPGIDVYVSDLLSFVIPHENHWLTSLVLWFQKANSMMTGNFWEKTSYLGIVNLVLVVATFRYIKKESRIFVWGLLFILVFALGVSLHVLGTGNMPFRIPLPYTLLENLPFFQHARNPARIMAFGYLFFAVLVGYALRAVALKWQSRPVWKIIVLILPVLIGADYFSMVKAVTPVRLPAYYEVMKTEYQKAGGDFAIMDVPWDQGRYSMYQTMHGIPNLQGYLGHKTGRPLITRIPFEPQYLSVQKQILTQQHVRYIIYHKKKLDWDPNSEKDRLYYLHTSQIVKKYKEHYSIVFEDEAVAVFKVIDE